MSKEKYVYPEENNQGDTKFVTGNFISNYQPMKSSNKQIQCVISASTSPTCSKKISVKTSTSNFQRRGIQVRRTTGKAICDNFPKIVIPRRIKTNIQTQDECSHLNCQQNELSILHDCINGTNTKEIDDEVEGKNITKKGNICDICAIEMDASSSQIVWLRMKRNNIYSTLQTKENTNIHSNKSLNHKYDLADWQNRLIPVRTSCPCCCNHISRKKLKNYVVLSNPTYYYSPSETLDFDMSNISYKLYDCLEKLGDMQAL